VEVALATDVEVVTDMQMPRQIGSEAETGKAQAVLADFDVDVHMHGQWRLRRFSFLADDLRVAAHRDRGWRSLTHDDFPVPPVKLATHSQLLAGQQAAQIGLAA